MKKQELRHDAFRENVVKGVEYFNNNRAAAIKMFAIIVLAVGGMSYYKHLGSIKLESAAHLAGRAQNIFIGDENGNNGNLDKAMVKFERVLDDYPNTPGAMQSLVYLLNDAVSNNDLNKVNELLDENDGTIEDPVVLGSIYKLKGDIAHADGDHSSALKYYQKAESLMAGNAIQTKYQLDIASALLVQNNYNDALKTLEEIIDNIDLGFNEKNRAEELLAYTKHKMGI